MRRYRSRRFARRRPLPVAGRDQVVTDRHRRLSDAGHDNGVRAIELGEVPGHDPKPPFDAGSPEGAGPEVTALARSFIEPVHTRRSESRARGKAGVRPRDSAGRADNEVFSAFRSASALLVEH